jgi:hypothetical protein
LRFEVAELAVIANDAATIGWLKGLIESILGYWPFAPRSTTGPIKQPDSV